MGKTRYFLGVDPGKKGGIAIMCDGKIIDCCKMPETRKGIFDMLKEYQSSDITPTEVTVGVEDVHAMPNEGVKSAFTFGQGIGAILGICTALGFRILQPRPQEWKKIMLVGMDKSKKESSIQQCENLFPDVQLIGPRCRVPSDGMAEAVLIAEWVRRQP